MKILVVSSAFLLMFCLSACSQNAGQSSSDRTVGGGCDGCDLIYEGMPTSLRWEATLAPAGEPGEPLIILGTIYKKDGKTPAPGIILYVYHTDHKGYYSPSEGQLAGKRHGHLRGWIKTDASGRYQFRTIKPLAYPDRSIPAHIHPIVKEPGLIEYYLDEYRFDDDPLLTPAERAKEEKRGGSGIISITKNPRGEWIGRRDIVLGLNIPDY
jgi:protocatechuate 3,4-dioxygenase beta subunit